MKNLLLLVIITLLVSFTVMAQSISIGEQVEFQCTRVTGGWCSGVVEAINGDTVKVKWGNMRDQFTMVSRSQLRVKEKPPSQGQRLQWNAFNMAVMSKKKADVYLRILAHHYDPNEFSDWGGHPSTSEEWRELMATIGEIDALCKGQYRGITNSPDNRRPYHIDSRYADWCKIADQRVALEPKARAGAASYMASVPGADDLKKALEYPDNRVVDDIQMLMYEPEKWRAEHTAKLKPHFANYGVAMPTNFLDDMLTKSAELKTKIDQGAPGRSFEMSAASARDATVETFVKGKWIAEYPGSQILKTSHSYPTWVKREGLSLVGSGTGYKLYKVEYSFYKRGWVLMKMPNRPYCQTREWIVGRGARGLVMVTTSSQGTFMKCQ
ncbi:MAG: hypothetical protein ABL959_00330 [Pyrinomonadaceae bacterium]